MEKAILLAIAASFRAATASVCQRLGARKCETAGLGPAGEWGGQLASAPSGVNGCPSRAAKTRSGSR
jgi:hypothetical protein